MGSSDNLISKEEFITLVHNNQYFQEYSSSLISEEPMLINPALDEDNNQIGYVAQYEIRYGHDKSDEVKFSSLLTLIYIHETKTIESYILDYSRIYEKKIYVHNLNSGISEAHSVDGIEVFDEFLDQVQEDLEEYKQEIEEQSALVGEGDIVLLQQEYCWICTEYISGGGEYHD